MSEEELAIIEDAFLGIEDHGLLTIILRLKGERGGWGQGFGTFSYGGSSWDYDDPPEHRRKNQDMGLRAFGLTVLRLLNTFGVYEWKELVGQRCWVRRDKPFGQIEAVKPLSFDRETQWFSMRDQFEKE